jgi:simple sugar transport system substrate-binding protein
VRKVLVTAIAASLVTTSATVGSVSASSPAQAGKWCSGMKIRFFVGGDAGTPFAKVVDAGAKAAQADTGATVEYVYSGWDNAKMLSQLKDAVAAKPNGIAMMGHAGDAAIMPMALDAKKAGILMMFQNVDVPKVREAIGAGYVGATLYEQGKGLAREAIKRFGSKLDPKKDEILVLIPLQMEGRNKREIGVAEVFEKAGYKVTRLDDTSAHGDAAKTQPMVVGAMLKNKNIKLVAYSATVIGQHNIYMKAVGRDKPGDVMSIGFDITPDILTGMEKGYVNLTSDQQPFLQGYLPVLSLCQQWKFGLAPLVVDTGSGFVDPTQVKALNKLAADGVR